MTLRTFKGRSPRVHASCFVEDSAQLVGDVELGEASSVWFNCVLRGDVHAIRIGRRTNIQDLSLVHVTGERFGTTIGDDVTVGHHVTLHGCTLGNRILIGMGAILLDGSSVADDAMVGAGALVTPGTHIPSGMLALGSPARVVRPLNDAERAFLLTSARNYVRNAADHLASR